MTEDITERKQAEEALRRSEERLRLAQQVARVGTFELDLQTGLNAWTAELEAMYGLSPGSFPQTEQAWENLLYRDDRAAAVRLREHTLKTGEPVEGEWRVVWPDGSVHWLAGRWQAIKDESGKPLRLIGVNIDITERKRAEEAIKESEAKLRTLFQMLPVGISILDEHCRVVESNPALSQILGMTAEGLRRGDYSHRQCLRGDYSPMPPEEYPSALAMKTGTVVSNVEVGVVREDGETVWASVSAAPLPVRGLGAAVVTMDITERKQDQEALEREHRTLKHLLQSSDHERQTIAYEIHDGLAQYLAGAIMQFDVYSHLRETKPKDAAQAYDAGMTMLRQGHFEARRLISGVRPPILDEEGVVAAVGHLVNEERRKKGPKIAYLSKVEFERLAPILENAAYRIAQEALTNACRHSKSKKIKVELVQVGDQLRIEVQDRGVGFKLEDVEEGQFGFAGIRERARLLGGKATIESKPGKGTRVAVELPIVLRKEEADVE